MSNKGCDPRRIPGCWSRPQTALAAQTVAASTMAPSQQKQHDGVSLGISPAFIVVLSWKNSSSTSLQRKSPLKTEFSLKTKLWFPSQKSTIFATRGPKSSHLISSHLISSHLLSSHLYTDTWINNELSFPGRQPLSTRVWHLQLQTEVQRKLRETAAPKAWLNLKKTRHFLKVLPALICKGSVLQV